MACLTWSYQIFSFQLLFLYFYSNAKLCSYDQSSALLQFKQLFSLEDTSSEDCYGYQQSYPKMKSWKEKTDCCSWNGVTCDMATGHVIGLDLSCSWLYGNIPSNSSLFFLSHLRNLNLAHNDFNDSNISPGFGKFPTLTHLNLSYSRFSCQLPSEISHLSNLESLDLANNHAVRIQNPVWNKLVQNLTKINELILDSVNLSNVEPESFTNLSSSLTSLSLIQCDLQGIFPKSIFSLPNLQSLSVTYNMELSGVFPQGNWSTSLRALNLHSCNFSGSIPASLGNLTQLTNLVLRYNNFIGHIPSSLSNLVQLIYFDLSHNIFIGEIPDIFVNLTQLSLLDFSENQLTGSLPSTLSALRNLSILSLFSNSLSGIIPPTLFTLSSLEQIYLSDNKLTGSLPSSISELMNLTDLFLSSNSLSGIVELHMFEKLTNLRALDLCSNRLTLSTTLQASSSFPKILYLGLCACNLSEFPEMLRNQEQLEHLELSENKIHGTIPRWMWDIGNETLNFLNLSDNFLTGIDQLPWKNLEILDLRSNLLQGPLMVLPTFMRFFSVSNNQLTGEIRSSIRNLIYIEYFDLSNNSFSGMIPEGIGSSNTLLVLDLRMNNFNGSIPQTFAKGNNLFSINLNDNKLEGPLPPSLVNCNSLEIFDVGNNRIADTFPGWLADLPELQVLILRSNRFHGHIANSSTRFPFPKLRILDISHNKFSGVLPIGYFQNLKAMMQGENNGVQVEYMRDDGEYYSMFLTVKGNDIEMERILTIFTTIDLSSNRFEGPIPGVVGNLKALKCLNFSHNNLTGGIPSSLGNLTALESLDLSSNNLVREIPVQLANLTSLSVLNLSYNQLEGPVPQGPQFNTFPNNSYLGNMGLCGFPLSEQCSNSGGEPPESSPGIFFGQDDGSSWFDWKIVTMGYGSGLVIGLSMGYLVFTTGRPWWFVRLVERMQCKRGRKLKRARRN